MERSTLSGPGNSVVCEQKPVGENMTKITLTSKQWNLSHYKQLHSVLHYFSANWFSYGEEFRMCSVMTLKVNINN